MKSSDQETRRGATNGAPAIATKEAILLVEDDPDIVELVRMNLAREGYRVFTAEDGERGLEEACERRPALVLLDLMLPRLDGLEVCKRIRQNAELAETPVVMLTAKGEESDIVLGLELGADDYLTKPFSPKELLARIRSVLRRNRRAKDRTGKPATRIELGPVVLDAERHEVLLGGESVYFTRAEFRLIWTLATHPGRVFGRAELVERITAGESYILDRNVDVHVSSIRKKLRDQADLIQTVRGVGYRCRD